jgi:CHAD domain-containing protein
MKASAGAREPVAVGSAAVPFPPAMKAAALRAELEFDSSVSAHDVALGELGRLIAAWHVHEPGARLGHDPEELHQLRVTARRIDATIALFKRQLPPALVRTRKATKAVLRMLGAARDLDVQLNELAEDCAHLPEGEREAAEPLRQRLESERGRARTRMIRALDSARVRRWLETLGGAGAQRGEPHGNDRAIAVMPERVRRRFRKLRKSVGKLRPRSSMDDYHQVRRRAKQLRYATECGAAMFGKPAEDLLKALRRLQNQLGTHQDAYMAQNRLAALTAEPDGLPPATLFLMGRLAERHARITAQARRTLDRSWRKVRGWRWRALRTRLAQLDESAGVRTAADALTVVKLVPHELTGPAPESAPRPIKH